MGSSEFDEQCVETAACLAIMTVKHLLCMTMG